MRTTISDKAAPCPLDRVNRQFQAPHPNVLWVSDFTSVATWSGFVSVACVGIPTKPAGGTDPEAGRCSDVKPATIPI